MDPTFHHGFICVTDIMSMVTPSHAYRFAQYSDIINWCEESEISQLQIFHRDRTKSYDWKSSRVWLNQSPVVKLI